MAARGLRAVGVRAEAVVRSVKSTVIASMAEQVTSPRRMVVDSLCRSSTLLPPDLHGVIITVTLHYSCYQLILNTARETNSIQNHTEAALTKAR